MGIKEIIKPAYETVPIAQGVGDIKMSGSFVGSLKRLFVLGDFFQSTSQTLGVFGESSG